MSSISKCAILLLLQYYVLTVTDMASNTRDQTELLPLGQSGSLPPPGNSRPRKPLIQVSLRCMCIVHVNNNNMNWGFVKLKIQNWNCGITQ